MTFAHFCFLSYKYLAAYFLWLFIYPSFSFTSSFEVEHLVSLIILMVLHFRACSPCWSWPSEARGPLAWHCSRCPACSSCACVYDTDFTSTEIQAFSLANKVFMFIYPLVTGGLCRFFWERTPLYILLGITECTLSQAKLPFLIPQLIITLVRGGSGGRRQWGDKDT